VPFYNENGNPEVALQLRENESQPSAYRMKRTVGKDSENWVGIVAEAEYDCE